MAASESILQQILAHKQIEVERQRAKVPQDLIERRAAKAPPVRPFAAALRQPERTALIAEVKKASPSRGVLIENFDPLALARTYMDHGATAISVLTDSRFFQGSLLFLEGIRTAHYDSAQFPVPLLRKDFIIDPYQVFEARAYGADALLLIVAALDDQTLGELLGLARNVGLDALVEVHDEAELDRALNAGATLIGVNNRNLHTFVTTLATTEQIAARLPSQNRPVLVSESGIFTATDVAYVRQLGVDAVLVGEALVTAPDIGQQVASIANG